MGKPSVGNDRTSHLSRGDSADECSAHGSAAALSASPAARSRALRGEPRGAGSGPAQRHLRGSASRPPPQSSNSRGYRIGRAYSGRFISGSPGRFLALTAEGKDKDAG